MDSAERPPGIIAAGSWCVDHVKVINKYPELEQLAEVLHETHSNGGGPYNLLKDLAKLGVDLPLTGVGLLGNDSNGEYILNDCRDSGIETALMKSTDEAPTAYTDVMSVDSSGRRCFFHRKGTNALLRAEHFEFERLPGRHLHLAYLNLLAGIGSIDPSGDCDGEVVLSKCKEAGLRTSIDLVSAECDELGEVAKRCLPYVDVLFANCFEIGQLSGLPTGDEDLPDFELFKKAARACFEKGVREFVIVHFPKGAIATAVDGSFAVQGSVRIPESDIFGTAGAGDAFAAGVLYGFHEGMTVEESLRVGVCVSASCLHHPTTSGGILPLEECLELARKHGFRQIPSLSPSQWWKQLIFNELWAKKRPDRAAKSSIRRKRALMLALVKYKARPSHEKYCRTKLPASSPNSSHSMQRLHRVSGNNGAD